MTSFPLYDINRVLLKQTISKLEGKSYFRLQQTCKDMNEIVRTSKDIHVLFDDFSFTVRWQCEIERALCAHERQLRHRRISSLYGVRFAFLEQTARLAVHFEQVCENLKKYRITAKVIQMHDQVTWNEKECEAVLKLLKPSVVRMDCTVENRWEPLLLLNSLSLANVFVSPSDAMAATKDLISKVPSVVVRVDGNGGFDKLETYELLREILRVLRSTSTPNLRKLRFIANWEGNMPSYGELVNTFEEFGPMERIPPHSAFEAEYQPNQCERKTVVNYLLRPRAVTCQMVSMFGEIVIEYEPVTSLE